MSDSQPTQSYPKLQASEELSSLQKALNLSNPQEVLPVIFSLTSLLRQDLSAKDYYNLFLQILNGLLQFSYYLSSHDLSMDLFNKAQHSIEIVPRLYTTITVGITLYEKNICPDILDDLIELVKGVQHPLRGLFLRYFLNKVAKNLHKENSLDSIHFLLKNLSVMNTMWSRIEDLDQREALKVTVGENIERLSFICTEQEIYMEVIFPRFMEIVKNSDLVSQQYLLDCFIQAFPDDFLLVTCDEFLEIACQIQSEKDVVSLVYYTLQRLLRYTRESCKKIGEKTFFPLFRYLRCLVGSGQAENFGKKIEVHGIILKFSEKSENMLENMIACLNNLNQILDQNTENSEISEDIFEILSDSININIQESVSLPSFLRIFSELSQKQKQKLALIIMEKIQVKEISALRFWKNCFECLKFLIVTDESLTPRLSITRLIEKRKCDPDFLLAAFMSLAEDESITIFICFAALGQLKTNKVFKDIIKKCIDRVQSVFLGSQIVTTCIIEFAKTGNHEEIKELLQKAGKYYERILDNSWKTVALYNFISATRELQDSFGYSEKIANYCFKIPKKLEQCHVLLALCHIFWSVSEKNSVKLLETLKRSVKLADLCVAGTKNLSLFVMILNSYIYFIQTEIPSVEVLSINSLIELIFELLAMQPDPDEETKATKRYLENTIDYISFRQTEGKLQEVIYNYDYKKVLY